MKRSSRTKRAATPVDGILPTQRRRERSHKILLGATVALLVAGPLIPCESAAPLGTHVVLVMAWFLLTAAWMVCALLPPVSTWHAGSTAIVFAGFLVCHSLSAIVAARTGHARPAFNAMWQWVTFGLLLLTIRQLFRSPREQRALCSAMLALAVGLAAFGFYQIGYSNPRLQAKYQAHPQQVLEEAEIFDSPGSPRVRQFEDRLASTEPTGSFALTNSLAGFLAPWLVILVSVIGSSWMGSAATWPRRIGVGLLLLAVCGCLLLTKSRSAYLATFIALGLLASCRTIPRRWLDWRLLFGVAATMLVIVAGVAKLGWLDRQVLTETPKSLLYRFEYWRSTTAMIADHPWLGCGPGNFQDTYPRYKLPQASETVADPHNFVFEIAATAGLPALLLLALVLVAIVLQIRRGVAAALAIDAGGGLHKSPPVDRQEAGSSRSIYTGCAVGVLLAFPAGWAGGLSPGLAHLWITLPAGLATLWLLHPWVCRGRLGLWPLLAACIALLVNLLAAGGIGYPGVGYLVWVLVAVTLNVVDTDASCEPADVSHARGGATALGVALFGVLLLTVACYFTMYRPVLDARRHLDEARGTDSAADRERSLRAAAAADPWSAEPWERLVDVTSRQWLAAPSARSLAVYDQAVAEMLARRPHSSSVCQLWGDRSLDMFGASNQDDLARRAIQAYSRAVDLYPNSNILHAQLAWTYHLAGDEFRAGREADEAVRLDLLLPHEEMKLANQRLVGDRLPETYPPAAPRANAEQRMLEIRKASHRG